MMGPMTITGAQVRAARALLDWNLDDLAGYSGIARRTLNRIEASDGVPRVRKEITDRLEAALLKAGILLIPAGEAKPDGRLGGSGVMFRYPEEAASAPNPGEERFGAARPPRGRPRMARGRQAKSKTKGRR
jgi:transcriptional regulator with XRE-family HTH domain